MASVISPNYFTFHRNGLPFTTIKQLAGALYFLYARAPVTLGETNFNARGIIPRDGE